MQGKPTLLNPNPADALANEAWKRALEENGRLKIRLATYETALRTISLGKSDGLDHAEDVARLERAVNIARKALEDNK